MIDETITLSKNQYLYIVAVSILGTLGVMGLCQMVFDIILGLANLLLLFIGIRGVWKRKKNYLFLFMWIMIGMAFLHLVSLAVVIILKHKNDKQSRFGFIPDTIIISFRVIYSLALSFFTNYIRNTLGYKRPASQLNRI
eukprot:gene10903-12708_t